MRRMLSRLLGVDFTEDDLARVTRILSNIPAAERVALTAFVRAAAFIRNPALLATAPKQIRGAISGLRAAGALAAYTNENRQRAIGYDGPWLGRVPVAVLPARDFEAVSVSELKRAKYDFAVIGLGAGGSVALQELSRAGANVIGVELGARARAADFTQRELEMLELLYRDSGLRANSDRSIGILQGAGIGGSTLHNTGLVVPPPLKVLERWQAMGMEFPLHDLADDVSAVLHTLHATQIPGDRINANNAALKRGADALGWKSFIAMRRNVHVIDQAFRGSY